MSDSYQSSAVLLVFLALGSAFFLYIKARLGPGPYVFATVFGCISLGSFPPLDDSSLRTQQTHSISRYLHHYFMSLSLPVLPGDQSPYHSLRYPLSDWTDCNYIGVTDRRSSHYPPRRPQCHLNRYFRPHLPRVCQRAVYETTHRRFLTAC